MRCGVNAEGNSDKVGNQHCHYAPCKRDRHTLHNFFKNRTVVLKRRAEVELRHICYPEVELVLQSVETEGKALCPGRRMFLILILDYRNIEQRLVEIPLLAYKLDCLLIESRPLLHPAFSAGRYFGFGHAR